MDADGETTRGVGPLTLLSKGLCWAELSSYDVLDILDHFHKHHQEADKLWSNLFDAREALYRNESAEILTLLLRRTTNMPDEDVCRLAQAGSICLRSTAARGIALIFRSKNFPPPIWSKQEVPSLTVTFKSNIAVSKVFYWP